MSSPGWTQGWTQGGALSPALVKVLSVPVTRGGAAWLPTTVENAEPEGVGTALA